MRTSAPPIAGPGTEVYGFASGWCWCGSCGYTGRVLGPRQRECKEWIWHGWLASCAALEVPISLRSGSSWPLHNHNRKDS